MCNCISDINAIKPSIQSHGVGGRKTYAASCCSVSPESLCYIFVVGFVWTDSGGEKVTCQVLTTSYQTFGLPIWSKCPCFHLCYLTGWMRRQAEEVPLVHGIRKAVNMAEYSFKCSRLEEFEVPRSVVGPKPGLGCAMFPAARMLQNVSTQQSALIMAIWNRFDFSLWA